MQATVDLSCFDNSNNRHYDTGRSFFVRAAWFFLAPRCSVARYSHLPPCGAFSFVALEPKLEWAPSLNPAFA